MSEIEDSVEGDTLSTQAEDATDPEKELIREELKNMPFEELIKLKQKLGAKVYNSTVLGIENKNKTKEFKRENKNRPREMSFKKPNSVRKKKKPEATGPRDPRFDEKCGEFSRSEFKKRYSFVEDMRVNELKKLKESLKKTDDPEERSKIKMLIQRMDNQVREATKRKSREEEQKTAIREMQKAKDEGRTPIFPNKKQQKLKELVKQFKDLKQTGKLQKHIDKRRKKNASRDRKRMNMDND
uniref:rRNA biogenesis protein RRP36 n=1 Tax=Phlebotomus papatasi TaxID=29031 RepID=A0A1B0EYD7_PHLPP